MNIQKASEKGDDTSPSLGFLISKKDITSFMNSLCTWNNLGSKNEDKTVVQVCCKKEDGSAIFVLFLHGRLIPI